MKVLLNSFGSRHFGVSSLVLSAVLISTSISAQAADPDQPHIDKARMIYSRLTGKRANVTSASFQRMVAMLKAGNNLGAAAEATEDAGFVNNTVRLFAAPIHEASQSYRQTELTESMAYIMGIIRDRRDYREILTGKNYYVPAGGMNCNNNEEPYRCLQRLFGDDVSSRLTLSSTPARAIYTPTRVDNRRTTHPTQLPLNDMDRSGIFSMEGFGTTGLIAGTNRRILQQFFNTMYCTPNDGLRASAFVLDKWVGPDVSRDPEGTGLATYRADCRGCHGTTFDGLRGAFAYYDAIDGGGDGTPANRGVLIYNPGVVDRKYTRNANNYPNGYRTQDNSWELMWNESLRAQYGWDGNGALAGRGVASLAQALTHFDQLPRCMVQKVAELVCPVDPNLTAQGQNQLLSDQLKAELVSQLKSHGDIRKIFEAVAVRPECLGK